MGIARKEFREVFYFEGVLHWILSHFNTVLGFLAVENPFAGWTSEFAAKFTHKPIYYIGLDNSCICKWNCLSGQMCLSVFDSFMTHILLNAIVIATGGEFW